MSNSCAASCHSPSVWFYAKHPAAKLSAPNKKTTTNGYNDQINSTKINSTNSQIKNKRYHKDEDSFKKQYQTKALDQKASTTPQQRKRSLPFRSLPFIWTLVPNKRTRPKSIRNTITKQKMITTMHLDAG